MGTISDVKLSFVQFELTALAQLLNHWAGDSIAVKKRKAEWPAKLRAFRRALIAGTGRGSREVVPHELVVDEYRVVRDAIKWLSKHRGKQREGELAKWLGRTNILCPIKDRDDREIEVKRPAPIPRKLVDRVAAALSAQGVQPSEVAQTVTAARLGIGRQTVKNASSKRYRGGRRHTVQQCLAASLFLDLSSFTDGEDVRLLQAKILDALLSSRYSSMAVCYLVQKSHSIRPEVSVRRPSTRSVKAICRVIASRNGQRPFGKLPPLA